MALLSEFKLISRIQELALEAGVLADCFIPIGDDAAAFLPQMDAVVISTDAAVEGVHFDFSIMSSAAVGYRSLAANVSDLSAMGAAPIGFLLSLVLDRTLSQRRLEAMLGGMFEFAKLSACPLMGGNIASTKGAMTIAITVVGEGAPGKLAKRGGAKEGDVVAVTGTLGNARAGLFISQGKTPYSRSGAMALKRAYGFPPLRMAEGRLLAEAGVSAMIDISDGLIQDLGHILEASRLGADIYADRLPISANLKNFAANIGERAYSYAMAGGEDYELLFTISPEGWEKLKESYPMGYAPLAQIGVAKAEKGVSLYYGGEELSFSPSGWKHF